MKNLCLFLSLSFLFTGCGFILQPLGSEGNEIINDGTAQRLSAEVMEYIKDGDIESLKNLFCLTIQETHDLDKEIAEALEFIDGEIISHDEPHGITGDAKVRDGEWIELGLSGRISNIVTDTGYIYRIRFHSHAIYKANNDNVGITYIRILSEEYNRQNNLPEWAQHTIGEFIE
jgi:hypothetical protein